jgi:hypothetical protein
MRAIVEVRKLRTIAGPKLRAMLEIDRDNWLNNCKAAETILLRIAKRGVG